MSRKVGAQRASCVAAIAALLAINCVTAGELSKASGAWRSRILQTKALRLVEKLGAQKSARSLLQDAPPACFWEPMAGECQLLNATAALPVGIFNLFNSHKEKFDTCFGSAEGPCGDDAPPYCSTRNVPDVWGDLCILSTSRIEADADVTELGYALEAMDSCTEDDFGSKCMSALMVSLNLMGCDCDSVISTAHQTGTQCFSQDKSTCPDPGSEVGDPEFLDNFDADEELNDMNADESYDYEEYVDDQSDCPACVCPAENTAAIVGGVLGGIIGLAAFAALLWFCCVRYGPGSGGGANWALLNSNGFNSQGLERAPSRLDLGPTSAFVASKGNERRFWFFGSRSSRNLNDMGSYPEVKLESSNIRRQPSVQYTTSNSLFPNTAYYPQEREN